MLARRLTLSQAVCLNMAMMVGIGPFVTIPLIVKAVGGPHALVIWVVGAIVAIADGLVWSELASAFPGSGGTYHFYDSVYGNLRVGRLLKFLFVWQFLFSGPLEFASGAMGLTRYAGYFWPALQDPILGFRGWIFTRGQAGAMLVIAALVALAYRRVETTGRLMLVLGAGMVATVLWVIVAGLPRIDIGLVEGVPAGAWRIDGANLRAAGVALGYAMYTYFGYYQVCYLGDEVVDPSRTIPRSILISVVGVSVAYVAMNVSILGVIPWEEMQRYGDYVGSAFMGIVYGPWAAGLVTVMILWTAAAGSFAAILGYSRVPYAAARSGHFFRGLAATHPTGDFPHRSLLLVGGLAMVACLADLETVLGALMASRIPIQFVGQIVTIAYIRRVPELRAKMKFRMWCYPLPALVALAGWLCVFAASTRAIAAYGVGSMALGGLVFLVWDRGRGKKAALEV